MSKNREDFRKKVFDRDNNTCKIPWCDKKADDAHHIVERDIWENGGYIPNNGVSVCNEHHQDAEDDYIPPQAFWMWLSIDNPELPESVESINIDKWGNNLETPPWEDLRDRIKYQSTRHILPLYWYEKNSTVEERMENDDTGLDSIEQFLDIPLVITHKMDGSNTMLVSDKDNPVRARNGSRPGKYMDVLHGKQGEGGIYWEQKVHQKLPDRLQVFGEFMYPKHSIHYGCDCETECNDIGPNLSDLTGISDKRSYFQIFGVYDKKYNIWLSWPETEKVADELGLPTTPVIYCENDNDNATFTNKNEAINKLLEYAHQVTRNGGEGIVVRSKYPFHYSQFNIRLGKYVRPNHVNTDEHWKNKELTVNNI